MGTQPHGVIELGDVLDVGPMLAGHRRVKSTSGHSEARAVIETDVVVGEHRFAIEITLTNRTDMGVPMLLGRSSIKGRFAVHPGKSYILSRKRKRKTP